MELYAFQLLRQVVKILFTVDMPVNAVCYAVGSHDLHHFRRPSLLIKRRIVENGENFLAVKFFRFYEGTFQPSLFPQDNHFIFFRYFF